MSTAPNPFADEPLPTTGPRLESAGSILNPYAAPASAEEYKPAPPPGIGLWRDGAFLVMHVEATFPERCVFTGEVSSLRYKQAITWYYPIDFSTRSLPVELTISPDAERRIRWRKTAGFTTAACITLGIFLCAVGPDWIFPLIGGWGVFACIAVIVVGLYHGFNAGRILTFRKVRYPYLWLQGAHEPFLTSLPTWPGYGGR